MGGNANSEHVNVTDTGLNGDVDRSCFNRGKDDHFTRDRRCPARGPKCDQCGEIGHFREGHPKIFSSGKDEVCYPPNFLRPVQSLM